MPSAVPLDQHQIAISLETVSGWQLINGEINRTYSFENFRDAISFVNLVAALAERAGHHPDIDIRYNKVKLVLVSHDAGGLTRADFSLAIEIDKLL